MPIDYKVAIATGASQGMDESIVSAMLERNDRVVGTARSIKPSNHSNYITVTGEILHVDGGMIAGH